MDGNNIVGPGQAQAVCQQRLQKDPRQDDDQSGEEAQKEGAPGLQLKSGHGSGGHTAGQQAALQQLKVQRSPPEAGEKDEEAGGCGDGRALDEAGIEDGQLGGAV